MHLINKKDFSLITVITIHLLSLSFYAYKRRLYGFYEYHKQEKKEGGEEGIKKGKQRMHGNRKVQKKIFYAGRKSDQILLLPPLLVLLGGCSWEGVDFPLKPRVKEYSS